MSQLTSCSPQAILDSGVAVVPSDLQNRLDRGLFRYRFGFVTVFGLAFLLLSLALRIGLLCRVADQMDRGAWAVLKTFVVGLVFDVATLSCIVGPVAIIHTLLPDRLFRWKLHRAVAMGSLFLGLFIMLFDLAAEWVFWGEFSARYNFVAVDYLVYTTEVIRNILESFPVGWIVGVLGLLAACLFLLLRPMARQAFESTSTFRGRLMAGLPLTIAPLVLLASLDDSASRVTDNRLNNELAKNGLFSLVAAFRNNVLSYPDFYLCLDRDKAFARERRFLDSPAGRFVTQDPADLRRDIVGAGPEKRCNVVLFVVESLSGEFVGALGTRHGLTPYLDKLADRSLLFTNFYATGTRTTRGLEAVTCSLPPTPGGSVVKWPENKDMFSLGQIFGKRGYDVTFVYGGHGYFDNMNAFFSGNGFRVVDQGGFDRKEITFANAWGACDEDLCSHVMKECDRSQAAGKPFFTLALTTSNHRPYSFPAGKIDVKSGCREGAVKYTDYALGTFIEAAEKKPWFDNTVFVIVADHCANSAGKTDIDVAKYRIPLFIFSPRIVTPRRVDKLAGQIDLAPTLLGILNFSYRSKFFGRDILADGPGRALLGNYQKIGLLEDDSLTLLLPRQETSAYRIIEHYDQRRMNPSSDQVEETVSYYQTADYVLTHGLQKAE